MDSALQRLEAVTARLEALAKAGGAAAPAAPAAASSGAGPSKTVTEFDAFVSESVTPFVDLCKKIGGDLATQVQFIDDGFKEIRKIIEIASLSKKPQTAAPFLAPIQSKISAAKDFREKNRASKQFNHISAVSEGAGALAWVAIEPTPGPFVDEMLAASDFYLNKVLKDFRGVDQTHVDWVNAFKTMLKNLTVYVKANHTTGLSWNPKGGDPAAAAAGATSAPAPPAGGAPPPPPAGVPPPPVVAAAPAPARPAAADPTALFSQINNGNVTGGLRKVTDDMKSKNRTDKVSVVPAAAAAPKATPTAATTKIGGTPKFELDGKKWAIEYQNGNKSIVIDDTNSKQTVYVYQCVNSVIVVKGKVNNIALDGCKKVGIVFDAVVANAELVNCTSVEVQVTDKAPSISIDKCSGVQIFLPATSLDTEIVSAKSDQMNVTIPTGDDHHDEMAIPEQYKTKVVNGKLVTTIMEHV